MQDRDLILGGVKIDYEFGLDGHSDADVLTHAIMDALLGAARLGDIGNLFPDTDIQYKNISSILLLKSVYEELLKKGFAVVNIDSIIVCQKPKLAPYMNSMNSNIAKALGRLSEERVNVKATTTEGLGFTGRNEGIAAYAVALLEFCA